MFAPPLLCSSTAFNCACLGGPYCFLLAPTTPIMNATTTGGSGGGGVGGGGGDGRGGGGDGRGEGGGGSTPRTLMLLLSTTALGLTFLIHDAPEPPDTTFLANCCAFAASRCG